MRFATLVVIACAALSGCAIPPPELRQQFAVPAWNHMFGVSESYGAFCLMVFIVGSAVGVLVGGFFADRVRNHERVAAIVVYGPTGRIRLFRYDPETGWRGGV